MDDDFNLYEFYMVVRKRLGLFILVFILIIALGAGITLIMKPTYQSKAVFFFPFGGGSSSKDIMSALGGSDILSMFGLGPTTNMSQFAVSILKSRTITDIMLDKYGAKLFEDKYKSTARVKLRKKMSKIAKVMLTKDKTIVISVTTKDPELSAEIANEYLKQYDSFAEKSILSYSKKKVQFTKEQLDKSKAKLAQLESDLKEYQEKNKVVDVPEEAKALINYYSETKTLQISAASEYLESQKMLQALKNSYYEQASKSKENEEYPLLSSDPTLASYYSQLTAKQLELMNKSETLTENHPVVINLKADIENVKGKIRKYIGTRMERIGSNLTPELINAETQVYSYRARTTALDNVIRDVEKRMAQLPELGVGYGRLYRDVKVHSQIYIYWEMELQKAIAEEKRDPTDYEILDKALPADTKHGPSWPINGGISLVLAIIFSFLTVFGLENLEQQKRRYHEKLKKSGASPVRSGKKAESGNAPTGDSSE